MRTYIKSSCLSFILASTIFFADNAKAQKLSSGEQLEQITLYWSVTMQQVQVQMGATQQEYAIFQRFCQHSIDSMHIEFINKINDGTIGLNNVKQYVNGKKPFLMALFKKFQETEQEFPSSVGEYKTKPKFRPGGDSCFSSCYNTNFADGTLDGWYGYWGYNGSPNDNTGPFDITQITGGYCGPVVKAGGPDPYTGGDYQIRITSGAAKDWFLKTFSTYSMSQVSPWGGSHSVMLGDSVMYDNGAAILSQSFQVTKAAASLVYQYSVFLEHPSNNSHLYYGQPFFSVVVLDQNDDTIPTCGEYAVDAYNTPTGGFQRIYYSREGDSVYWKDWTLVNVPLKHYIGQCVTIVFQTYDCALGGHFGYAYVGASCAPLQILASSPNFCGQDSIMLTGPPGATSYLWRGPKGGIRDHDSITQTIAVDSPGIYELITVPVTGAACADTLYDTLRIFHGIPPHPSFTAPAVCAGQPTEFTNTSHPDSGTFSWDFYNIGIYNYTDLPYQDTSWTYASPGTYTVKLHQLSGGCGTDTVIKVVVDTPVGVPSFTASPLCSGDTTYFTPSAQYATHYTWNFGDPLSGIHNVSSLTHPGHDYHTAGTYTVTLKAINSGNCDDSISQVITILAAPHPLITGPDSVCVGSGVTLNVTGAGSYVWTPGNTTNSSVFFIASADKTYTVNANNGGCVGDTTFTVKVFADPTAADSASKDSVCSGDSLTIWGGTGLKFKWAPGGQATSVIHVSPTKTTTYTFYSYAGTCIDSSSITIPIIPVITASIRTTVDSICPLEPATLTATGIGGQATYSWSPGGETTDTITVSPDSTTTYTATVNGLCNSVQKTIKVTFVPLPNPVISGTPWKCRGVRDTLTVSNSNGPVTYVWSDGKTGTSIHTGNIYADSTVSVTAYNKLGCSHDTTFSITLRYPDVVSISAPVIFCAGQQVIIGASSKGTPSAYSYSWSPGGQTTDSITISPEDTTVYAVTVSNGCIANKSILVTPNYPLLSACCNQTLTMVNDTVTPSSVILMASGNSVKYQWTDSSNIVCLNPPLCDSVKVIPSPSVTTTYTVTGTDSSGCQTSQVITINVDIPCFSLTLPNVFTPTLPGPDGVNSEFYIKTDNIDAWSITIFDRWGKEMFQTTDQYKYWNGNTESGGQASAGVYYYIITATCQNTTYKKDGFLQLIR